MPSDVPQIVEVDGRVMYVDYDASYVVTTVPLACPYKEVHFTVRWDERAFTGTHPQAVHVNTIISRAE